MNSTVFVEGMTGFDYAAKMLDGPRDIFLIISDKDGMPGRQTTKIKMIIPGAAKFESEVSVNAPEHSIIQANLSAC